jgi:hypothetical protein
LIARKLSMAVPLRRLIIRRNRRRKCMKSRKRRFCTKSSPSYSIRFKGGLVVNHH